MVPWHMQPKYTSGGTNASQGIADAKAARKRARKQLKREKRSKQSSDDGHVSSSAPLENDEVGVLSGLASVEEEVSFTLEMKEMSSDGTSCNVAQSESKIGADVQCLSGSQLPAMQDVCGGTSSEHDPEVGQVKREVCRAELGELGYTTYQRYYHVFREGELVQLFHRIPYLHIEEQFYDHENWCVLAQKISSLVS